MARNDNRLPRYATGTKHDRRHHPTLTTDNGGRCPGSARHMNGYLRQFIPNNSTVTAPISDILREPRFRDKRARRVKVPWGEFQQQAKDALIKALTSPPILALPDWDKPFRLHTDASEIGVGVVLTQFSDHLENILIYASHKWSVLPMQKNQLLTGNVSQYFGLWISSRRTIGLTHSPLSRSVRHSPGFSKAKPFALNTTDRR